MRDNNPGPGLCFHTHESVYSGFCGKGGGFDHYCSNLPAGYWAQGYLLPALAHANIMVNDLNWSKLPTSNKFQLIQFLAELDDTLLIFTKKFWKSISYGSFSWGLMPFVNDVTAVYNQVVSLLKKADDDLGGYKYHDTIQESMTYEHLASGLTWTVDASIKVSNNGLIYLPNTGWDLPKIYDVIGFQPSLSTVWDLIPLSFLVDYLIPIGSFLDSLKSSSGWTQYSYFSGWSTILIDTTIKDGVVLPAYGWETDPPCTWNCKYFQRASRSVVLNDVTYVPKVDWINFPTFTQLFNIIYVFTQK
jgi:hypothetical protein